MIVAEGCQVSTGGMLSKAADVPVNAVGLMLDAAWRFAFERPRTR
jgi:hypothetical protein